MRKINKIILHCSATPEGRNVKTETIREWHISRNKWVDIGYHYIIELDGSIHEGRKEEVIGAHCYGENKNSIGICYIGGVAKNSKTPKDTRTMEQKEAMIKLVKSLMQKYNLDLDDVYCHNQFTNKACPSFSIEQFRNEFAK